MKENGCKVRIQILIHFYSNHLGISWSITNICEGCSRNNTNHSNFSFQIYSQNHFLEIPSCQDSWSKSWSVYLSVKFEVVLWESKNWLASISPFWIVLLPFFSFQELQTVKPLNSLYNESRLIFVVFMFSIAYCYHMLTDQFTKDY